MILTKEVEVKPTGKMIQYYKDLGYDAKCRKPLIVKVEDLPKRSCIKIEVLCDMCMKNKMMITYEDYIMSIEETGSRVCKQCLTKKASKTNKRKYGVPYIMQNDVFKEKRKKTYLKHYGVENPAQAEEVKEKQRNTVFERYGVDHQMKSPIFKEKLAKTLYKNGSQTTSRQQLYLHKLFGGKLNYPIKYYDVDICFPDEKLIIEYDGSGHDLNVKFGRITQKEFNQKEIIRGNIIRREGYKQIRIISTCDKLPSDDILLRMLLDAKQYFSTTNHSWINYDIDNSKMINAENKCTSGVLYNYGVLRTIKEVA